MRQVIEFYSYRINLKYEHEYDLHFLRQACGLVKNLALMVYITVGLATYPILEFLEEWGTKFFEVCTFICVVNDVAFYFFFSSMTFLSSSWVVGNFSCSYSPSHKKNLMVAGLAYIVIPICWWKHYDGWGDRLVLLLYYFISKFDLT